jgi:hypothetical protein
MPSEEEIAELKAKSLCCRCVGETWYVRSSSTPSRTMFVDTDGTSVSRSSESQAVRARCHLIAMQAAIDASEQASDQNITFVVGRVNPVGQESEQHQ